MQDNPYQPPPETRGILRDEEQNGTDHFASATKATLQQKQVPKPASSNQHHFWIALAACPLAGPILTILMITTLGFLFQASGWEFQGKVFLIDVSIELLQLRVKPQSCFS